MIFLFLYLSLSYVLGTFAASPQAIPSGVEKLITPGVIKTESTSLENCARACLQEKGIKCQFFKFVNSTKSCYLSEKDSGDILNVVQDDTNKLLSRNASISQTKQPGDGSKSTEGQNKRQTVVKFGQPESIMTKGPIEVHLKDRKKKGAPRRRGGHPSKMKGYRRRMARLRKFRNRRKRISPSRNRYRISRRQLRGGYGRYTRRRRGRYRIWRRRRRRKLIKKARANHRHVKLLLKAKRKINSVYSSLRKIKKALVLLVKKYNTESKSDSELHGSLGYAFRKISQNKNSINKSLRTNAMLVRTIRNMRGSYRRMLSFARRFNLSTGKMHKELRKLMKFEKRLRGDLNKMNRSSSKIRNKIRQIKSTIKRKMVTKAAVKKIKHNQRMIAKAIMEVHKHGLEFAHHMITFHNKMGIMLSVLKYAHKRIMYFKKKFDRIEEIVEKMKRSPKVIISGPSQVARELRDKYAKLKALQTRTLTMLKTYGHTVPLKKDESKCKAQDQTLSDRASLEMVYHI